MDKNYYLRTRFKAMTSPPEQWRSPLPSATFGASHITSNEGYFAVVVARQQQRGLPLERESPLALRVSLSRSGRMDSETPAPPLTFETFAGPAFGRCFWLQEGVEVTVEACDGTADLPSRSRDPAAAAGYGFVHYLKPLNRGPMQDTHKPMSTNAESQQTQSSSATLPSSESNPPLPLGIAMTTSTQRPFCCAMCFRRIQGEKDALNHFRDKHGRERFQSKKSAIANPSTNSDCVGGGGGGVSAAAAAAAAASAAAAAAAAGGGGGSGVKDLVASAGGDSGAASGGKAAAAADEVFEFPPLEVAFEDDHMAVVIKPQGIAVQGDQDSLVHCGALMDVLKPSPLLGALRKPRPCHRLDAPTVRKKKGVCVIGRRKE
jgi:hypothetical protein